MGCFYGCRTIAGVGTKFSRWVKRDDLAVDDHVFGTQQFQGIDKFGVVAVEIRSVAQDEPNLFATLKACV